MDEGEVGIPKSNTESRCAIGVASAHMLARVYDMEVVGKFVVGGMCHVHGGGLVGVLGVPVPLRSLGDSMPVLCLVCVVGHGKMSRLEAS